MYVTLNDATKKGLPRASFSNFSHTAAKNYAVYMGGVSSGLLTRV
jgi:hypothetical protein